jgi:hypothetical protein
MRPISSTLRGRGPAGNQVISFGLCIRFDRSEVGTTSKPKTLTLSNPGTAPLHIVSLIASGDFAESNNCPASLATGKHCAISVIFKPAQKGKRTGKLTIKDTARTSPQTVSLTGTGTQRAVAWNVCAGEF